MHKREDLGSVRRGVLRAWALASVFVGLVRSLDVPFNGIWREGESRDGRYSDVRSTGMAFKFRSRAKKGAIRNVLAKRSSPLYSNIAKAASADAQR